MSTSGDPARPAAQMAARRGLPQRIGLYVVFAFAATAANLLAQEAVMTIDSRALALSILAGTIVGFGLKYLLDKLFVFEDAYASPAQEIRKVVLYGLFSIATTLIFWSFEIAFWLAWGTAAAKYTGAVIGLAIGYALKFWVDSKYVFVGARS